MNIIERIELHAQHHPMKQALQFDDHIYTYKALIEVIEERATLLEALPRGSCVALYIQTPMEMLVNYLALHKQGCLPCVLDGQWPQSRVTMLVERYDIPYIVKEQRGERVELYRTVAFGDMDARTDIHTAQLLHIGFTSGTTGLPKAYYRDMHSWLCSFEQNEQLWQTEVSQLVAPGPLAHSLSLYVSIYALYYGYRFLGQSVFDAQQLIAHMDASKDKQALFVVPTMLYALHRERRTLDNVTHILTTGAKLEPALYDAIPHVCPHAHVIEFFGSSEASFIGYNLNRTAPVTSVGRPFDNVEVIIQSPNEAGVGSLFVRSDMVFSGYVNEKPVVNHTVAVGDLACVDKHGYLYLKGRQNDMMIIGGKNIYPSEIETCISNHFNVDEMFVFGVPHKQFGERAILLYTGDTQLSYQDVRTVVMSHLSRYHVPSKCIRVAEMRYTSSGKIARHEMKEAYLKEERSLWDNQS